MDSDEFMGGSVNMSMQLDDNLTMVNENSSGMLQSQNTTGAEELNPSE